MFSRDVEIAFINAEEEAKKRKHEFICVEHLLYALLCNKEGSEIIRSCGGNVTLIKKSLETFFEEKLDQLPDVLDLPPQRALGLQRLVQRAVLHGKYAAIDKLGIGDLLAAIFTEPESHAVFYLAQEGISRLDILEFISHGDVYEPFEGEETDYYESDEPLDEEGGLGGDPLERFTENLNKKASEGLIDPLIGRENEVARIVQILSRRNKNNPLLVGEQGVGKTALAEGLALKIAKGEVPDNIADMQVYALDLGSLLAGTKYRGDFEQRFKVLTKALAEKENAILFIDEIHTIVGAGATSGNSLDAANMLKPLLTSRKMRCMGSTTFEEAKNHFEKDRALARRFSKVEVLEPNEAETLSILKGLVGNFEQHHKVKYTPASLQTAAQLSAKYLNERFLPDKAIDLVDEAGAMVSIEHAQSEKKDSKAPSVRPTHIEQVVSKIARIPAQTVSTSDRQKLEGLEKQLKQVVFGQDRAITDLVTAIKRSRAGLVQENKPIGCFLFVGPTGVGKTEVCKQLSKVLGLELLRYDMSEYMEKHSVARLIGASPGYVGFDQGGLLVDAVAKNPHSVLLLDEIEKAHSDLFNILLQIMDNASLTDSSGKKADFRNIILVMTSNAGSEGLQGQAIGFDAAAASAGKGAIDKLFRPEFRNRLDSIVKFSSLEKEIVEQVVDKFIAEIDSQLVAKKASIVLSREARTWLAEKGFDQQYGARAVNRFIQKNIKDPLAEALLFGPLQNGGQVTVGIKNDELLLKYAKKKKESLKKKKTSKKSLV